MKQAEILAILKAYKVASRERYSIQKLGIFGSAATNTMTDQSDVDVVVVLAEPDLLILSGIKQELEEQLQLPVDVIRLRSRMNPFLKKRIENGAIFV